MIDRRRRLNKTAGRVRGYDNQILRVNYTDTIIMALKMKKNQKYWWFDDIMVDTTFGWLGFGVKTTPKSATLLILISHHSWFSGK